MLAIMRGERDYSRLASVGHFISHMGDVNRSCERSLLCYTIEGKSTVMNIVFLVTTCK